MKFKIYHLLFCVLLFFVFPCKHSFSQEYTMPSFVHAIDACDMDMDGSYDIIASCAYEDTIVILFNDGFGNFDPYYFGRPTGYLLCGCIDGDGIPDIVTTTDNLNFIKNNGDRTITESVVVLIQDINFPVLSIIDMNNDGWNDIVYDRDTYWGIYKNNGNLTFTNIILSSDGGGYAQPSIGFFNNDSLPDIVISYSYDSKSQVTKYLINEGNFNFITNILDYFDYTPIVSEMNNIFPDDLTLFYNPSPEVHLYENIGNSTFISRGIHYIRNSADVIFADKADYNQDGFDDFSYTQCFWTGCTDSLYIELNDQNWAFERAQQYYIGTLNWFRIKSADLNGDHYPDFYMTGYDSNNKIKILWNNGFGFFSYENPVGINTPHAGSRYNISAAPNPFLNNVTITINAENAEYLFISIYDMTGRKVKGLQPEGWSPFFTWDGHNDSGLDCPAGMYLIFMEGNKYCYFTKVVKC